MSPWVTRIGSPHAARSAIWGYAGLALALLIALFGAGLLSPGGSVAAQARGPIYTLDLDGVIGRYSVDFLRRALHEAEAADAEVLIVRLSSSGAVLSDLRAVADDLAVASVPIVVYVAPPGTQSGAAGVWLLSAAHIAAMAPNTSLGLATPLIDPRTSLSEPTRELLRSEVIDQLQSWNDERGRNSGWVDQAVRTGIVLNNEQASAAQPPMVDIIALDRNELQILLEGRLVRMADGEERTLATLGRTTQPLAPTLPEQILLLLANPTIAFLFLVLAGIAIYAELVTPTVGALAAIGVVMLGAAFVGLVALPVNWLAVLGVFIAFGLIAADLFLTSHGAVSVIGLIIMVFSAMTMFDPAQAPGVSVALWAILLVTVGIASFAAMGIYLAVRTRKRPIATGQEGLVGRMAEVRRRLEPEGMVFVEGALWRAVSEEGPVETGEWVQVTGVYELRLSVRRPPDEADARGPQAEPGGSQRGAASLKKD